MNPQTALLALVTLTTAACAASAAEAVDGSEARQTAAPTALAPGKYVDNGRTLMIYGQCSAENFLGEAAKGAIDSDGIMHAEEGDVCGAYQLRTTEDGVIQVTWKLDQTASAHRDPAVAGACRSNEGSYAMMQAGQSIEPKPGRYVRSSDAAIELNVAAGCSTPSTLGADGVVIAKSVIARASDANALPFIAVEEGDVCNGFTLDAKFDGTIAVKWLPAADASASHDPQVVAACRSVEGDYVVR